MSFTITEGATAFASGDRILFAVRRPAVGGDGPFPVVVVAHGNHLAYRVGQP